MSDERPTPKQQRFVDEFLRDLNGTQAAIRAGYSARTAESQAWRLLRNARVAAAIQRRREQLAKQAEVSQERIIEELRRVAFADLRELVTWNGTAVTFVASNDLTLEQAAVVASVKAKIIEFDGDDVAGRKIELELKTHDKLRALEMLGRHLGLFKDAPMNLTVPIYVLGADRDLGEPVAVVAPTNGNGAHPATNGRR